MSIANFLSFPFCLLLLGYEHELEKAAQQDQKKLDKSSAAAAAFHPVQAATNQYSDAYETGGTDGERQPLTANAR